MNFVRYGVTMLERRLTRSSGMPISRRRREPQMILPASRRSALVRARSSFFVGFSGPSGIGRYLLDRNLLNSHIEMTLVNSLCAEISIFEGMGEPTGLVVERSAIRGKKGLCESMRDLAIKSRVLGDGVYYIPIDLWPKTKEPVIVHKHDWTVISSIPRTSRSTKKKARARA